ncbi:MAG: hypothetical protein KGI09_00730 [Thaumarchaeota archaeon]|nr:hypothetical protein [Nitrososphaerota archaeon]MDE1878207.1 hypothetical protein [Nitrososphaerota archaeon]
MKKIYFSIIVGVALISMISSSYALQEVAGKITLQMKPGENQNFNWGLLSDSDNTITVSLSASGNGSQFLSFPKTITLPPHQVVTVSVTATVPSNYNGQTELTPYLFATQAGQSGGPTILNVQVMKIVTLNINETQNTPTTSHAAGAVPEFPFAIPVLIIAIMSLIVIHRLKSSNVKI